jgi:tRNA threonylcarbamoyladenosine biosynthesis protein TsaB
MAIILNIDCAQETAAVGIARDGECLAMRSNAQQTDHASWVHLAIQELLAETGLSLAQTDAVAVTSGPGSYTGLRVGMATAKGLCYALQKPLICIPTLEMMAYAARHTSAEFICPMIDARRMEVYAAIYDKKLNEIVSPEALILEPTTYHTYITAGPVCFTGSGSKKLQGLIESQHAQFEDIPFSVTDMSAISYKRFQLQDFASLAYAEPLYIKEFYTAGRRK